MSGDRLVILAAGMSSRMKNSAHQAPGEEDPLPGQALAKPKSMLGVGEGNRPFLDYLLFNAREAGYQDIVLVVGANDRAIRNHYGEKERGNHFRGLTISYAVQEIPPDRTSPLGTADALHQALLCRSDWRGHSFTVCNGDNLYSKRAFKLMSDCCHENALVDYDRSALQFAQSKIEAFSVIQKNENSYLLDIIEKPGPEALAQAIDAAGRVGVSMNLFRLYYDAIFPYLENIPLHPVRLEKELPATVVALARDYPESVYAIPVSEHIIDLTNRDDIGVVKAYLKREFKGFAF